MEAHFVADLLSQLGLEFFGDAGGDATGSDAARLGVTDEAIDAALQFQAHFGELGGFAGAGFATNDDDLVLGDSRNDLGTAGSDRQFFRVLRSGEILQAQGAFLVEVAHGDRSGIRRYGKVGIVTRRLAGFTFVRRECLYGSSLTAVINS